MSSFSYRRFLPLLGVLLLALFLSDATLAAPLHKAKFLSLEGKVLSKGNPRAANGTLSRVDLPLLQLSRAGKSAERNGEADNAAKRKGTLLLVPGGDYTSLRIDDKTEAMVQFLNRQGFDVALLEHAIGSDSAVRSRALSNLDAAYELLQARSGEFGLQEGSLSLMGFLSGAHLAARFVMNLNPDEQPHSLMLFNPLYMDETVANGVYPAVAPPFAPKSRLFVAYEPTLSSSSQSSSTQAPSSRKAIEEYSKTWKGYDGFASFHLLTDTSSSSSSSSSSSRLSSSKPSAAQLQCDSLLTVFFSSDQIAAPRPNTAAQPVEGGNRRRHAEKVALVANHRYDLIFIGNSITHNLEKPQYQPVWNQFYAPRNALNLGYSGYRTENILWNIANGELEGQSPKVIVLEIGTNNIDEKNYPVRHTAGELAGGIEAIVKQLRQKCPDAKIVVLRCFPGCYGGPNPTSHRAILDHASNRVSKLADGKHIFYCDVNHVFINMDGSINQAAMPDWLHPGPAAAKAWAQAMEPLISELMGDKSLDTEIPENTAIVPVSKLENDSYDWWARHAEVLRIKDSINPEIVLIGNSITHFWGGTAPALVDGSGRPRRPNGPQAWESVFGPYRVLNLGFGWDRTQNVLWRLDHGQLDALNPRLVVIHIGTNNTAETRNARMNSAPEIVEGIAEICRRVRSKVPGATIVLMKVFPREASPTHPRRILIAEINTELSRFAAEHRFPLLDITPQMLAPDGTLSKEMAPDYCHPTEKGYAIWAELLKPYVR